MYLFRYHYNLKIFALAWFVEYYIFCFKNSSTNVKATLYYWIGIYFILNNLLILNQDLYYNILTENAYFPTKECCFFWGMGVWKWIYDFESINRYDLDRIRSLLNMDEKIQWIFLKNTRDNTDKKKVFCSKTESIYIARDGF